MEERGGSVMLDAVRSVQDARIRRVVEAIVADPDHAYSLSAAARIAGLGMMGAERTQPPW
jgi:hypothetical protein